MKKKDDIGKLNIIVEIQKEIGDHWGRETDKVEKKYIIVTCSSTD